MKVKAWLRITSDGQVSALKQQPMQESGQVCVPLALDIPDEAFQPPRMPVVEITLDAAALPKLTVLQDAMDSLQGAGVRVKIVEAD